MRGEHDDQLTIAIPIEVDTQYVLDLRPIGFGTEQLGIVSLDDVLLKCCARFGRPLLLRGYQCRDER